MSTFRRLEVGAGGAARVGTPSHATLRYSLVNLLPPAAPLQVNGIPEERKVAEALDL